MQEPVLLQALDDVQTLTEEEERIVIEAFMERYDVDYHEANEIFEETKKWLWLASKGVESGNFSIFIDKSLVIIDEMWHNFILHTKLYYRFCMSNFRRIIHHVPTSSREKKQFKKRLELNPEVERQFMTEATAKQLSIIYDELGPETVFKWYDTIASKYTPEYLDSIKKG